MVMIERPAHRARKAPKAPLPLRVMHIARVADNPDLAERMTWLKSDDTWSPALPSPPAEPNAYTVELHVAFNKLQEHLAATANMACIRLADIHLVCKTSTLVDLRTNSVLVGGPIGLPTEVWQKRSRVLDNVLRSERTATEMDPGETYVLIDQPGIQVYGHLLLDIVPRIFIAETFLKRRPKYLIRHFEPWMKDSLQHLGIEPDRFVIMRKGQVLHFDELYVPLMPKAGWAVNVGVLRSAWAHFVNKQPLGSSPSGTPPARLFLSRGKLKSRPRVGNEDALYDIARRFNFELVHPETLSFADQMRLFASAGHIVGEDGSALHNAIFCRHGRSMIAFMRPDRDNLWHLGFTQAAGMDFYAIKCRMQGDSYTADAVEFERLLQVAVAARR